MFGGASQGKTSVYYSRGPDVLCGGSYGDAELVTISDQNNFTPMDDPADSCSETPILYLNDIHDDFKPSKEGDKRDITFCENDFSVSLCDDSTIQSEYREIADYITGISSGIGSCTRGLCDQCNPEYGEIESYKSNDLRCGFEIVQSWAGNHFPIARIAVQSRGDAYYVFGWGNYDINNEPHPKPNELHLAWYKRLKEWQAEQEVNAIGPFVMPDGSSSYINIQEWQNSGLNDSNDEELTWLITNPNCLLLNDASWSDWQVGLIQTGKVSAICGFKANFSSGFEFSEDFWGKFSSNLWNTDTDPDLWSCPIPSNQAIVAWMQSACLKARENPYINVFQYAAAADGNNRYFVKYDENTRYPILPRDWYIFK